MSFLQIKTRDNNTIVKLNIIRDTLEVIPELEIKTTDLNHGEDNFKYTHFFNNGYGGITFKCQVIFDKREKMSNTYYANKNNERYEVYRLVHDWYVAQTPLLVSTDAMDLIFKDKDAKVVEGLYLITKNGSRKQTSENYSVWDMEFKSYTPLNLFRYKNDNTAILKALNKAKTAQKTKNKTKSALLSACDKSKFKKSKKKKSTECNKILQKVLKENGCYLVGDIDGWYGPETAIAIAKFQKKIGALGTGKIDNKTFKALIK